ncbi:MAG TPA: phage major capsid protein [Dehalococcoidia bacterium]|nr:phage major capsid protein [Dehalococcoidia bacterium]
MSKLNALREERGSLAKVVKALVEDTSKKWGPDQQKVYDEKIARIDDIDAEIGREQKVLDLMAAESRVIETIAETGGLSLEQAKARNEREREIFRKWARGGDQAVSNEEWKLLRSLRNTMSTTTAAEGGYTVPTTVAASVFEALKEFGGMRDAADVFATSSGEQINYPTTDGTAEVGELIGENTTATGLDPSFGVVSLSTFKYSSKIVAVPYELLQDSNIDVEALIRGRLGERLGRITNQHYTTGTGSGQPRGVVTGSTVGKTGTTGQTTTVIYDDLIDLEHSVDPAYRRRGAGYMMADSSVKVIRKIKDTQGRPIFVPGYEVGSPGGAPDTLLGRPIIVNNDVAAMAANAKSILFGLFKNYKIRDVMAMSLFRFTDSAYTKLGQVGFLAWMRTGGQLVDVSGTSVRHYANSAT